MTIVAWFVFITGDCILVKGAPKQETVEMHSLSPTERPNGTAQATHEEAALDNTVRTF